MKRFLLIIPVAWLICSHPMTAQDAPALTLENIFKNQTFTPKSIRSLRWLPDNQSYACVEDNPVTGGQDIVRYQAKNGVRTVWVSANSLIPSGQRNPLPVSDYEWSSDHTKLLVFTNTKKVWRYHTRGDYWVLDINSGQLTQLGKNLKPSTLMFAKFSPDSKSVAYVSQNNIYVESLDNYVTEQLTFDGNDHTINGTFDWVYEEELSCRDGFRWSPDSRYIAYWQSDTRGTGTFYMINNIDSVYSELLPLPYPKVGTTNADVRIGVLETKTKTTRWFDIPGDGRNNYLARMDFIPESEEVFIQQLNRLQNTNKIYTGNVTTMELRHIMTDKDDAFLNIHDNIKWLDNQESFTWTSEKDGWCHLYKVTRDGSTEQLITHGHFDIIQVVNIDTHGGYVYYLASPENPVEQYLYRSRLDGTGQAERITPEGKDGFHVYQMSPHSQWAIHRYEKSGQFPQYHLVSLPDHKTVRVLEDNAQVQQSYDKLGLVAKEFFRIQIQETQLDAWMIKPVDFDPNKKYPVIVYVYGEPAGATVQNKWDRYDLWHQYMAQHGYVVVSIDPRGTKTPRGREWRKSIYEKIGIVAADDHAAAVEQLLRDCTYLDAERIGIWGWSGGGSMTLNCLFKYPHLYHTGIAIAFVSLQELYDTIYQERYMGLPTENTEGYRDGSPLNFAQNLEGNLLLIHGTADDNVHYQSFEMLVDRLIQYNKLFSVMTYPMRSHSINERENTSLHLYRTMEKYWLENL